MSNNRGKPTVADTARREAKLLAKPSKLTLDPFGKLDVELKQPYPKELGEYAVIVIATPMTTMQFTIAHPIGVTDLDETSWVAHRSDQLQGMLARAKDPNQAALDQSRTAFRQHLAVQNNLLIEKEESGKKRFFYPHRNDSDRNQLLDDARAKSKEASSQIKSRIGSLTDENKREKQGLLNQLHHVEDPLNFLDESTSKAETELRKFYQKPEVIAEVFKTHPQKYRTLSGPYFTVPQVKIPNSENLRVEDVAIRFARDLAKGGAVIKPQVEKPEVMTSAPAPAKAAAAPPVPSPARVVQELKPTTPPVADSATEEVVETTDPETGRKSFLSRLNIGNGKKEKAGN